MPASASITLLPNAIQVTGSQTPSTNLCGFVSNLCLPIADFTDLKGKIQSAIMLIKATFIKTQNICTINHKEIPIDSQTRWITSSPHYRGLESLENDVTGSTQRVASLVMELLLLCAVVLMSMINLMCRKVFMDWHRSILAWENETCGFVPQSLSKGQIQSLGATWNSLKVLWIQTWCVCHVWSLPDTEVKFCAVSHRHPDECLLVTLK